MPTLFWVKAGQTRNVAWEFPSFWDAINFCLVPVPPVAPEIPTLPSIKIVCGQAKDCERILRAFDLFENKMKYEIHTKIKSKGATGRGRRNL